MNVLELRAGTPTRQAALLCAFLTCSFTAFVWNAGVTVNDSVALLSALSIATLWCFSRRAALLSALVFFLVKPLLVRVTFMLDHGAGSQAGHDVLGLTPALVLTALIALEFVIQFRADRPVWRGPTRLLLLALLCFALFSALFQAGTLWIGLAGLERNFVPNMLVLILAACVLRDERSPALVLKVMLVLGLISCPYAIGQWYLGAYPWETAWLSKVAFRDDTVGWLTVGLRGLELRVFSLFYGYMDFFFTNVLVFALVLVGGDQLTGRWRQARLGYLALWGLVLLLSLERMPLVMCIVVWAAHRYVSVPRVRRRRVLGLALAAAIGVLLVLQLAAPLLLGSGASTLKRLGELANPLSAASIQDRKETKWGPALERIRQNPLGVGLGFGSESRATSEAAARGLHVQPHNELLQKALELGLLGAVVYLLLLGSVFRDALRLGRLGGQHAWFGRAMVAASIAFLLCGMVNLPFSGSPGLCYWAFAGLVLAQLDVSSGAALEG